ncbi:tautomerase family protein [Burkholderia sp. WAC0059]|uniref:tautomerase family protein n=1 Tax=Burkholderia sp. WAC0059 TaxID=2066022 RepID=UPI002155DB78|nr:tautomerase family protein [Burkholderia sp. WAC0059]
MSDAQKQEIATSITNRHCEATGAPPFFVQVVIEEEGSSKRFIGGLATTEYIWIRVDMRAGRSEEQREALMLHIVGDVSRISGIPAENVWINLCMLEPTDMVEYGRVLPGPGKEQQWFETLPLSVRMRLESLGIDQHKFQL